MQAGTGTGKSLAYLVPALLVDGPVVVSTATLALQSQLVDHDLPRLAEAAEPLLGRRPTFAVLKGRHHYLCLAKVDDLTVEEPDERCSTRPAPTAVPSGSARPAGSAGRSSGCASGPGDRRPATGTNSTRAWTTRLAPGVDAGPRVRRRGPLPVRRRSASRRLSRDRAREADIVVTNHSLLAFDMLAGRHIMPPHQLLVIDEAHELADRVSSAAQAELTPDAVDRAARGPAPWSSRRRTTRWSRPATRWRVGLADAPAGRLTSGLPAGAAPRR